MILAHIGDIIFVLAEEVSPIYLFTAITLPALILGLII
jgi:hypothetical protein